MQLPRDEVHCWYVDLDVPPEMEAGLYATLAGAERSRSARFRFDRDRRRFVVAHGVLRGLLARYLGTHPSQVHFVRNALGKPELGPGFGRRLKFNLSHSADLAAIAVAHADVGVDVESIRSQPELAEIARSHFSAAEVEQLNRLPSHLRAEAFFRCWTRKEAQVKARGEGLDALPLTTDPVRAPRDPHGASADIGPERRWSLHALQPAPGYVGALAIEGSGWRLTERDCPAGVPEWLGPRRFQW